MVNDSLVPWQAMPSFVKGMTWILAIMGVDRNTLVAVNDGILPEPLAPSPIPVLSFVQAKEVAAPPKTMGSVVLSRQTLRSFRAVICGL